MSAVYRGSLENSRQDIFTRWETTIKYSITCKSKNILYYMVCTICGEDYVGQTKDFRKRMNNHKSNIRGTPTADTLGVDKPIHYCQLQKYNTLKDPIFRVIPFLTVKDQKRCECLVE